MPSRALRHAEPHQPVPKVYEKLSPCRKITNALTGIETTRKLQAERSLRSVYPSRKITNALTGIETGQSQTVKVHSRVEK
jgi:hypothetical protein